MRCCYYQAAVSICKQNSISHFTHSQRVLTFYLLNSKKKTDAPHSSGPCVWLAAAIKEIHVTFRVALVSSVRSLSFSSQHIITQHVTEWRFLLPFMYAHCPLPLPVTRPPVFSDRLCVYLVFRRRGLAVFKASESTTTILRGELQSFQTVTRKGPLLACFYTALGFFGVNQGVEPLWVSLRSLAVNQGG